MNGHVDESMQAKEYGNLVPHILETNNQEGNKEMKTPIQPKYNIELEFLGSVDSKEVEEEIITILKGQILSRFMSGNLQSEMLPCSRINTKEVQENE